MSGRNKREPNALRGLAFGLAVMILAGVLGATWQFVHAVHLRQDMTNQATETYCSKTDEKACEERRAVVRSSLSDETTALAGLGQMVINVLGLLGLGLTVFYARKAWLAALKSADAAEKGVLQLERPWLVLDGVGVTRKGPLPIPNNWTVSLKWKNIGRAPAEILICEVKMGDMETLPPDPEYSEAMNMNCPRFLGADRDFDLQQFGPSAQTKSKSGETEPAPIRYVIYGRMRYREMGGDQHETGFSFEVSAYLPAIAPYGAGGYDYYT